MIPFQAIALTFLIVTSFQTSVWAGPSSEEVAQKAVVELKTRLVKKLTEAIAKGGPVAAVDLCKVEAPKIAADLSVGQVQVGRTSHRLRNPANSPKKWVEPILADFQKLPPPVAGAKPISKLVQLEKGAIGYAEPLFTQPLCLGCHGDPSKMDAKLKEALAQKYPHDQATGFKEGELRGLVWVEVQPSK
jgi:hypothetical protein